MQFVQLTKNEIYCLELKFIFPQKLNQPLLPFLVLFPFFVLLKADKQVNIMIEFFPLKIIAEKPRIVSGTLNIFALNPQTF